MAVEALIGLGSNLGDRKANVDGALAALSGRPGVRVRAVSPYHETPAVGGPGGQGAFLNAAASLESTLGPEALLDALNAVEADAGRRRDDRWGARTLDLDLLVFGDLLIDTPRLSVPHPRMALRRFVLAPLAEIAPLSVDRRTGRTAADLLANLDRRPSRLTVHGPVTPATEAVLRGVVRGLGADLDTDALPGPGDPWLVGDARLPGTALRGPSPTFAVLLGDGPHPLGSPWTLAVPTLRPGSDDPDEAVAEVLATCAGTRAG
jgi:2-amino-4-hydroxy-6-hydroxymethyldihydropteridine diphosphokinase